MFGIEYFEAITLSKGALSTDCDSTLDFIKGVFKKIGKIREKNTLIKLNL